MRLARLVSVSRMKFIDIGANLTDTMYAGDYNGTNRHPGDLAAVLDRAQSAGVEKMMVTGGSLEESRQVVIEEETLFMMNYKEQESCGAGQVSPGNSVRHCGLSPHPLYGV